MANGIGCETAHGKSAHVKGVVARLQVPVRLRRAARREVHARRREAGQGTEKARGALCLEAGFRCVMLSVDAYRHDLNRDGALGGSCRTKRTRPPRSWSSWRGRS